MRLITHQGPLIFKQGPDIDITNLSCSQAGQDLFVLAMTQCKKNGTWLEIGCGHAKKSSNTWLLEHELDWSGTSIDIEFQELSQWKKRLNSHFHCMDALQFDFTQLPNTIDYLSLDVDNTQTSLILLDRLKSHKFAVITIEHDSFCGDYHHMWQSRKILSDQGYTLVVNGVTLEPGRGFPPNKELQFEDWWVSPEINESIRNSYVWLDASAFGFDQPIKAVPIPGPKYPKDILFLPSSVSYQAMYW